MNKVLIIFYGGTGLFEKKEGFRFIEKKDDIKKWMEFVPEISFISKIDTVFIEKDKNLISRIDFLKVLKTIKDNIDDYDGILITNEVDTIPIFSNQLFWQIHNPKKPIVITGSNVIYREKDVLPDLSFRANLINGLQLINTGFNGVSVIYGNRVISPTKIYRSKLFDLNIFDSADKKYLARVDFGLSLDSMPSKEVGRSEFFFEFDDNFLFFKIVPSLEVLKFILDKNQTIKVIIFEAWTNNIISRDKLVEIFEFCKKNNKLIIFYNQLGFGKDFFKYTILTISHMTQECLCAKISWILGQTKNHTKIREMLKDNWYGEFIKE